ncbi:hypothetical protein CXQ85_005146 [Candidozyma haemuli]|uniref:Glutaredoxin-like protein n=1 Tax=Candidozyma haemuli TaxID=45357 RepID=A0A2V1AXQ0_9ASCO|nr:hypothetical protein CXQ85_005146 [[Candida] haemuloni]PVH22574.1 hypothetical protein CXQ85_005146 [[Candida] haemuloni]
MASVQTLKRFISSHARLGSLALTFYTKDGCQLCKNAKGVLDNVIKKANNKALKLEIIDISKPENSDAFDKYCYDVPVLHVNRADEAKPVKFMHYFDMSKILQEINR